MKSIERKVVGDISVYGDQRLEAVFSLGYHRVSELIWVFAKRNSRNQSKGFKGTGHFLSPTNVSF